jgi:hypothetical protein
MPDLWIGPGLEFEVIAVGLIRHLLRSARFGIEMRLLTLLRLSRLLTLLSLIYLSIRERVREGSTRLSRPSRVSSVSRISRVRNKVGRAIRFALCLWPDPVPPNASLAFRF